MTGTRIRNRLTGSSRGHGRASPSASPWSPTRADPSAAGDRLYALYSGNTRAERPGRANFGQQVHVFTWDGALRRVIPLDQPVLGISDDGRTMYAIRHDPEPAVLRYTLPAGDR